METSRSVLVVVLENYGKVGSKISKYTFKLACASLCIVLCRVFRHDHEMTPI